MTTIDPSRFVLVPRALARRAGALLLLSMTAGAPLAGCGDNGLSPGVDPFAEYDGVWAIDKDESSIDCPTEVDLHNQPFSIWNSSFIMESGVLADIVEVQGSCQLNYHVDPSHHTATLLNPDPYTSAAPTCQLTIDASTGENLVLSPVTMGDQAWTFQLLQPTPGKAPPSQIVGTANVVLMLADVLGNLQTLNCKFAANVNAHKIAKP